MIFTDNDGLAARLAHELRAELVILMTDVDGVFTGPPNEDSSKLIDAWCPEVHEKQARSYMAVGTVTVLVLSASIWRGHVHCVCISCDVLSHSRNSRAVCACAS